MTGTLERLLERIADGVASSAEVARARDLVAGDARLPEELREIGLTDASDLVGDAVGLLAVLGAAPLFGEGLREALHDAAVEAVSAADLDNGEDDGWLAIAAVLREGLVAEADGFEVADAVMVRLPPPAWAYGPAMAEAVRGEAGAVDVAEAAMASVGESLPAVAEAVRAEAGDVDVLGAVAAALGFEWVSVAEAVIHEAGRVDVAPGVLAALGQSVLPVAEAVLREAGAVDVARPVADELGFDQDAVADAVRFEAGAVDITEEVLSLLGLGAAPVAEAVHVEAGVVDVVDEVRRSVEVQMPQAVQEAPSVPAPANRNWTWGAVALAAVALLTLGVSLFPTGGHDEMPEMHFAAAGELVVEDLEYADDVVVMQAEGDEGAVILWMEDV